MLYSGAVFIILSGKNSRKGELLMNTNSRAPPIIPAKTRNIQ